MNRPAVLKAAFFACRAINQDDPTVRELVDMFRRIAGKGIRTQEAAAWLRNWETTGTRQGSIPETKIRHKVASPETSGKEPGNLRAGAVKDLEFRNGDTNVSPTLVAMPMTLIGGGPPPPPKPRANPAKPTRLISAYAGTTLESFGPLAPLVREVLAVDGHGIGTKAFARALETLAMWRSTLGDAALGYGLTQAAERRKGHRYAGGVARNYDPVVNDGRRIDEPNASDLLPTMTELIAAGKLEPVSLAAVLAERPSWFQPP